MGEWKKSFDRIMDQLYNHPEEMRERLLSKYGTRYIETESKPQTAIEMLRGMN